MIVKYRPCYTTRITSGFEYRISPITGLKELHTGLDFSPLDKIKYKYEPIIAIADGIVEKAYLSVILGNNVRLNHGDTLTSRYYHMSKLLVNQGDKVKAGTVIGLMGGIKGEIGSGSSTGMHLHFEIRKNGVPFNPKELIKNKPFLEGGEKQLTEIEVRLLVEEILIGAGKEPSTWAKEMWNDAMKDKQTDGTRPRGYATREEVIAMIRKANK